MEFGAGSVPCVAALHFACRDGAGPNRRRETSIDVASRSGGLITP